MPLPPEVSPAGQFQASVALPLPDPTPEISDELDCVAQADADVEESERQMKNLLKKREEKKSFFFVKLSSLKFQKTSVGVESENITFVTLEM